MYRGNYYVRRVKPRRGRFAAMPIGRSKDAVFVDAGKIRCHNCRDEDLLARAHGILKIGTIPLAALRIKHVNARSISAILGIGDAIRPESPFPIAWIPLTCPLHTAIWSILAVWEAS